MVARVGSPLCEEPSRSDLRAFRESDGVVNVYAEVANGILDVGVTQQDLHGPQVAGRLVDQRSFRSPHRVRAVF